MDLKLKKAYRISRIVLTIITFIVFKLLFIYDLKSLGTVIGLIFAVIVFGISFPSAIISKYILKLGNKIKNIYIRILYYIFWLPILFILFILLFGIIMTVSGSMPVSNDMGVALSDAFMTLFILAVGTLCMVLPYIQTLIVLVVKRFIKDNVNKI